MIAYDKTNFRCWEEQALPVCSTSAFSAFPLRVLHCCRADSIHPGMSILLDKGVVVL